MFWINKAVDVLFFLDMILNFFLKVKIKTKDGDTKAPLQTDSLHRYFRILLFMLARPEFLMLSSTFDR